MKNILLLIFIFSIYNCSGQNKIDYRDAKVLKEIAVIDRKGAELKQQADKNAKTLVVCEYGTSLEVIEEKPDWFGVKYIITKKTLEHGKEVTSEGWEKVYVLKSSTGSSKEITLIPSDLNIIYSTITDQAGEASEVETELKDFLKIELISKQMFESKKGSSVNFLLADTTTVKKKKGVLALKCKTKIKKYIDKTTGYDASIQIFNYLGQFEFLNKYLVKGSYYENVNYIFIDKNSGKETNTFDAYPYISADKKYIICINPLYDMNLTLYSIVGTQIKNIMSSNFRNWEPIFDDKHKVIFWNTDGYLYLAVRHRLSFWDEKSNYHQNNCQYIRIKVL